MFLMWGHILIEAVSGFLSLLSRS